MIPFFVLGIIFFGLSETTNAQGARGKPKKNVPAHNSPDLLSPEAKAIKDGLVFLNGKHFDLAIEAFRRVPDNSTKYRSLARFYEAIAHLQQHRWQKASQLLRSATRLPRYLQAERRRLLRELAPFERDEIYFRSDRIYTATPAITAVPSSETPEAQETPSKPVGFSHTITPGYSYGENFQRNYYHGYSIDDTHSQSKDIKATGIVEYTGYPRSFGSQPVLSLKLDGAFFQSDRSGTKTEYSAFDRNPETVFVTQVEMSERQRQYRMGINPAAQVPITDYLDATPSYQYQQIVPIEDTGDRSITKIPSLKLDSSFGKTAASLEYKSAENSDQDSRLRKSSTSYVASANYNGTKSSTIGTITLTQYDYYMEAFRVGPKHSIIYDFTYKRDLNPSTFHLNLSRDDLTFDDEFPLQKVPEKKNSLEASWSLSLTSWLSTTAKLGYAMFSNYLVILEKDTFSLEGEQKSVSLGLKFSVGAWVNFSTSYGYSSFAFQTSGGEKDQLLRSNLMDQQSTFNFNFALSYPM